MKAALEGHPSCSLDAASEGVEDISDGYVSASLARSPLAGKGPVGGTVPGTTSRRVEGAIATACLEGPRDASLHALGEKAVARSHPQDADGPLTGAVAGRG